LQGDFVQNKGIYKVTFGLNTLSNNQDAYSILS